MTWWVGDTCAFMGVFKGGFGRIGVLGVVFWW